MNSISLHQINFKSIIDNFDFFCKRNTPYACHKSKELSKITGGYFGDEISIIGGRPSMGKSSFLLNEHLDISINQNVKSAFLSLQHTKHTLFPRIISMLQQEDFSVSQYLNKSDSEQCIFTEELKKIDFQKLNFYEIYYPTIEELSKYIFELTKNENIKIFFIDKLQLICSYHASRLSKAEEIEIILSKLKELARLYNLSIILSSDVSRSVENRGGDKKPQLSDLRSSGSIEILADKVLFIYRPEIYNILENDYGKSLENILEILIEKNPRGKKSKELFHFNPFIGVISELEKDIFKNDNKYFESKPKE